MALAKSIGIVVKIANPGAVKLSRELAEWLNKKGVDVYSDSELAGLVDPIKPPPEGGLSKVVDVMVVLGGDGTMLYAARLLDGRGVPILGINMGGLGFLTALGVDEVYESLERVIKGEFETEERMMLAVRILRGGEEIARYRVLNDAVIKTTIARLVRLETCINKEYVTTYRADGLIVATPTGSTAYSLSASGPILYPTIHSIIVVPVCPFNLTHRPVVLSDTMDVQVTVGHDNPDVELTLDGQVDRPLKRGDVVDIKRADECVYLVKCNKKSYFDILRERLMWESKPE